MFRMNRSIFIAALAALAAGSAAAQSSVTIYGRLNATVERQKPASGDSVWVLQNNASRIGFKGSEDLGGGLSAGFQIEHGFSVDTGSQTQGAFWARQSEVFLGSRQLGTLRLGNFTSEAYYASADYVSLHNHDTGTSSDALYAYLGRNTNKIAYASPEFVKGLNLHGSVSLPEGAAGLEKSYDLAANYVVGPLQLGAGYEKNGDANQFAVRALYEFGDFVVGGYVQRDENAFGAGKRNNVRVSGMYKLGLSEFHANVGLAGKTGSIADSGARQFTLGYNYNLSKRTKVYTFYTKLDDKGAGLYGGDFSSIAFGVRHNF
jgi:predicted porin